MTVYPAQRSKATLYISHRRLVITKSCSHLPVPPDAVLCEGGFFLRCPVEPKPYSESVLGIVVESSPGERDQLLYA